DQGRHQRHLLALLGSVLEDGRLPAAGQRAPHQGRQQCSGFINQHELRSGRNFFFTSTQSWASQCSIWAGSRSRACWSGFWGVMRRCASQALTYWGWKRTPNAFWMSWATRQAVHSSLGKPKSVALRPNQDRTVPSWAGVSLGVRPGWGLASRPWVGSAWWRAHQSRTVRGWTPKKAATLVWGQPSAIRVTAKRRRRSSSAAEPRIVFM